MLYRPDRSCGLSLHRRPSDACEWLYSNTYLLRIINAMSIPCTAEVRRFLSRIGKSGGRARVKSMSRAEISASAQVAITARWMKRKFGVSKFSDHAFPGSEIVDGGMRDLCSGGTPSASALVVAELLPRLRQLGVPVPKKAGQIKNPRESLYRLLELEAGDGAHSKFHSLLGRADSFCASLLAWSRWKGRRAHRKGRSR